MAEEKGKVAFGFNKKVDKRPLADSVIREKDSKDLAEDTDYVLSISGKKLKSTIPEEKKKELVIPLIVKNNWRLPSTAPGSNVKAFGNNSNDLESLAVKEILEETRRNADGQSPETDTAESNMVIPMYMQNRVPEGYETDDKLDVALRAEESTLDDYENVPIEEFGLAMLKGMGWNPDQGIGAKNKRVVVPCEVVLRPKGLGLGANPRLKLNKASNVKESNKESKALVVGAYVKILSGINKGLYGEVLGLDSDNARVMVKLTISSDIITASELYVEVVSKSEYKKDGKLINKAKYDEYKAKEELKSKNELRHEDLKDSQSKSDSHHRDNDRDKSSDRDSSRHRSKHEPDSKKHSKKHSKDDSKPERKSETVSWVYPMLRVRFIDKRYKNGLLYNSKIIIDDVVNKELCICRTENGRILEDIPQQWLETLIPKSSPAIVMVVQGVNRGQLGEILDKNKKRCIATVQLLQDKNLVQLDYDSICEYAGKVSDY